MVFLETLPALYILIIYEQEYLLSLFNFFILIQ